MVSPGTNPETDVAMQDSLLDFSSPKIRRLGAGVISVFPPDALRKVHAAYQRDGRLAAAATARMDNPGLSLSEALYLIDQALGLRKASPYP